MVLLAGLVRASAAQTSGCLLLSHAVRLCTTLSPQVWDGPLSCAWAGMVLVSDAAARLHGARRVGLPSSLARFRLDQPDGGGGGGARAKRQGGWWGGGDGGGGDAAATAAAGSALPRLRVTTAEAGGLLCALRLPAGRGGGGGREPPRGPPRLQPPLVSLSLPSFSGRTRDQPRLLRYALGLRARVRPCGAVAVEAGGGAAVDALRPLLAARPLLTLAFDDMRISVAEPAECDARA